MIVFMFSVQNIDKIPFVKCPVLVIHVSIFPVLGGFGFIRDCKTKYGITEVGFHALFTTLYLLV